MNRIDFENPSPGDIAEPTPRLSGGSAWGHDRPAAHADPAMARSDLARRDIQISFHHDILGEFATIHELVNTAEELNFTKLRWPPASAEAETVFKLQRDFEFESSCGYIKASDRHENHGIVGFYMRRKTRLGHFLFSSRVKDLGIEQFVWQRLGKPAIKIVGAVGSELGAAPDWITVVDDADRRETGQRTPTLTLCLRGACDIAVAAHYLRARYDIIEETQYPYKGWNVVPLARHIALPDELESEAGRRLAATMPGPPLERFHSAIVSGAADAYVLSFAPEIFARQYKSRSTGLVIPFSNWKMTDIDYRQFSYAAVAKKAEQMGISEPQWAFLRAEFAPHGFIDVALLARDARVVMTKLRGKIVIVLKLNTTIGSDRALLDKFRRINDAVLPVAREFGAFILDEGDYVASVEDLRRPDDRGTHYQATVYERLARDVHEIIGARGRPAGAPRAAPPGVA